ncbi:unnamed protein product, partial [Symbiodinium sp. CCMP2456]
RDVYNPNMIKYFYEERAHATMRASALLRSRDETSMDMPVEQGEDGSVAVGQDVNLGDLGDASMVGSGSGSTVSGGAGEADIQLPSLEGGKKASSAPAARIVRLAKAIEEEQPGILGGIRLMSKLDLPKAEQRLHALAKQWSMTVPVAMKMYNSRNVSQPMILLTTWFHYLLNQKSEILLGGFSVEHPHCSLLLEAFWRAYQEEQPTHMVFRRHSHELSKCIPYMLFGDEGRSLRKSPIQIVCLETVFGQSTFDNYRKLWEQGKQIDAEALLGTMTHTGRGSSFLSRILLYALPHALYRSDSEGSYKQFWYDCMDQVSRAAVRVFEDGIPHAGGLGTFYGVCVGFKGDAPFLAKAAHLKRTFMSVQGHNKGICPDIPWEDVGSEPVWVPTIGRSRPWKPNKYSSVRSIPFTTSSPEQLLQPDLFHLVKLGIARHFAGSFLVLVAHWGYFFCEGRNSFPDVLARMYTDFRAACKAMHLTPHIKGFTKDTFHFVNFESWPWGGWKGSDTLLILRWMILLLRQGCCSGGSGGARTSPWLKHPLATDHALVFKAVHDGCCAILTLFQVAQKQGIWLDRPSAVRLHSSIDLFCSSYRYLAGLFFTRGLNRFHLEPTLHQLKHISIRIQEQLANDDIEASGCSELWSPDTPETLDQSAHGLILPGLLERSANYLVQPYGQAVSVEGGLLSRAYLVPFQDGASEPKQNVVLRLRHSDWHLLEDLSQPLRVIQAICHDVKTDVIMDCTQKATVVIGSRALVQETTVQMAELFCGGFAGWSQAAWVLHKHHIPISTRWTLDVDEDCHRMLQLQQPELDIVRSFEDLEGVADEAKHVHIDSSIDWDWWLHCFAKWPVNMVVASPPGQPWNPTAQASGLESADGRLLLRIFDICSAFQVPVLGLELSSGFFRHPHYPQVVAAWQAAGYELHWQAPLNLLDVLPCARPRCFVILCLQRLPTEPPQPGCNWASSKRANLKAARAIFDHPPTLHANLILSAEELAVYMDPWYMPPSRSVQHKQTPALFRLRTELQCAGCFLPQYQKQHYIPESQLARQGMLGFLLRHKEAVRFFSGAEIASLHGAVRPLLLQTSGDSQMKLLGGSSAVPQTIACLTHACHALGIEALPAPEAAVNLALAERIHNGNSLFLPAGPDCILCRKDQVCEVLATGFQFQEVPGSTSAAPEFVTWTLHSGEASAPLCIPAGADPQQIFDFAGLEQNLLPQSLANRAQSMTIHVASCPVLTCGGFRGGMSCDSPFCVFASAQQVYIVDVQSPRMWPQLLNIFDDLGGSQEDLVCFSACGQRLWHAEDFEGCVVADTLVPDAPALSLSLLHDAFQRTELRICGEALHISCPVDVAVQFWLGFPFQLTEALGWTSAVVNFPCQNCEPMELQLRPSLTRLHVCPGLLPSQLRIWYMVARLEANKLTAGSATGFQVELQVVARRCWQGYLPGHFCIDDLGDWWRDASEACGLPPDVRVFSGPHPLLPATSVHQARQDAKGVVVRRTGALLLTLHPSCVGGGVKATTNFVDDVSNHTGANKLFQTLSSGSEGSRWQQVVDFARRANVSLPVQTNQVAKAEVRARRQATRKKQDQRSCIRASEVSIAPGFFQNEDGTDASILESLKPGATGVLLTDGPQAVELLHTMQGVQPDELALLVLGHECPCPADGCRSLSFPATGRHCGSPLLLAGCLHNLGGKKVLPQKQQNIDVELPDVVCCTFVVYADDCDPEQWKGFAASPVKSVVTAFAGCATDKALSEPWRQP